MRAESNRKNFTSQSFLWWLILLPLLLFTNQSCQATRGTQPDLQSDANYQAGLEHFNNKNYSEALKAFSASIDENKRNKMAYYYRGHSYQELGLHSMAAKDLKRAVKLDDEFAEAWSARGFVESRQNNFDKAIEYYNKALEIDPSLASAWNNRGISHYNKGNYRQAIADFTQAIQLDSNFALAWNNRGSALYYNQNVKAHERDIRQAINDFTRAIQLDSSLGIAWRNRGIAYNMLEEYEKAMGNLDTAIKLKPNDPLSFMNRGKAYEGTGNYDKALDDYRHALELNPGWAEAYIAMGNANRKNGDFDRAIQDYWTAIDLKSSDQKGRAYFGLAALFAAQGDKEAMFDYLERARKEDFFKDQENRKMLETEKAFDSFRSDTVFKRFVRIAK